MRRSEDEGGGRRGLRLVEGFGAEPSVLFWVAVKELKLSYHNGYI